MEKQKNQVAPGFLVVSVIVIIALEYTFHAIAGISGIRKNFLNEIKLTFFLRNAESALLCILAYRFYDIGIIGLDRSEIKNGIVKGLAWSACFGAAASAIIPILWMAGLNVFDFFRIDYVRSYNEILWFYAAAGIAGPVAEEIFFRGIVFGYFRKYGFIPAVIVSTFFFVSAHTSAGIPLPQIAGGLVFACLYEKTGSLVTSMIVHISGNAAMFTLGFIGRSVN